MSIYHYFLLTIVVVIVGIYIKSVFDKKEQISDLKRKMYSLESKRTLKINEITCRGGYGCKTELTDRDIAYLAMIDGDIKECETMLNMIIKRRSHGLRLGR